MAVFILEKKNGEKRCSISMSHAFSKKKQTLKSFFFQ